MIREKCKKCGQMIGIKQHTCPKNYNLIGEHFGYLTVIERIGTDKHRHVIWKVRCICGKEYNSLGTNLRSGDTQSCGCKYVENRGVVHGKKLPFGISNMKAVYRSYKQHALKRILLFELTLEDFELLTSMNCYYCGREPETIYKGHSKNNGIFKYNGIDRVDNNIGYTLENSVPCCNYCNWMKRERKQIDFIDHIEKIYNHLHKWGYFTST